MIERTYRLVCDGCGKYLDGEQQSSCDALEVSKRRGWIHLPRRFPRPAGTEHEPRHLCPDCVLNMGGHKWSHPFVNHPHGRKRHKTPRRMQCSVCQQWGTVMTIATECPGPVDSV